MKLSVSVFGKDYFNHDMRVGICNRNGIFKGEIRLRRDLKKRLSKARRADAKAVIREMLCRE
jgi:hypothetical protein